MPDDKPNLGSPSRAKRTSATIYDIARLSAVSPSTVSRALNKPGRISAPTEKRIRFARRWMGQILGSLTDRPGPILLGRVVRRLQAAGVADADALAPQMLREQAAINEADLAEAASGAKVPHLLKSARNAGLLAPEILEALGVARHPLLRGALRATGEPKS